MSHPRRTQSSRPAVPTAPAALNATLKNWKASQLLDDLDRDRIESHARQLIEAASDLGISHPQEMPEHSTEVLRHVTGLKSLTKFTDQRISREANAVRNTLAALLAQIAIHRGESPLSVTGKLPTMMPENGEPGRAAHDDEILLLRLTALYRLTKSGQAKIPGIAYVLVEAGAFPSETTVVSLDHIEQQDGVVLSVDVPGVGTADIRAKSRTLIIPDWAAKPLGQALKELSSGKRLILPTEPIAYRGKHEPGGHDASATASSNAARLIKEAGLAGRGLTGLSPNRWRALHVLKTEGLTRAQKFAGKPTMDGLLIHLHNPAILNETKPTERVRGNKAKLRATRT
jgi:hypothetical protein